MTDLAQDALEALRSGSSSWEAWRASNKGVDPLLAGSDLSEIDLSGCNLAGLDLTECDLYRSNLVRSDLKLTQLRGADLSHANLDDVDAYKADLTGAFLTEARAEGADLSAVDFTGADLRGCRLAGANLSGCNLTRARLNHADLHGVSLVDGVLNDANFTQANLTETNLTGSRYGGYSRMHGHFYGIRGLDATYGNALFVRDAKDQDYLDTLELEIDRLPEGRRKSMMSMMYRAWGLIDYGRSLLKVGWYAFIIATVYGLFYTLDMGFDWGLMDYSTSAQSWFTPFYYSIVTYTTLGFGDVTANSALGEMIIISEVIVGYFTLGLLLSILANTIARRS
jgi:uncharacterized protein YjbI with pentapeptide repeats